MTPKTFDRKALLQTILDQFRLDRDGDHGPAHWARVRKHAMTIGRARGADLLVVELFSFFARQPARERVHGPRPWRACGCLCSVTEPPPLQPHWQPIGQVVPRHTPPQRWTGAPGRDGSVLLGWRQARSWPRGHQAKPTLYVRACRQAHQKSLRLEPKCQLILRPRLWH